MGRQQGVSCPSSTRLSIAVFVSPPPSRSPPGSRSRTSVPASAFFLFDQPLSRAPQMQAPPEPQVERLRRAAEPPQAPDRRLPRQRGARYDRDRYAQHLSLFRAAAAARRCATASASAAKASPGRACRPSSRKAEWPDWTPPAEMIAAPALPAALYGRRPRQSARRPRPVSRQLDLPHPRHQCAVEHRPQVSSGCIRMLNEDVIDLYSRVNIGTKVVVLPAGPRQLARQARSRDRRRMLRRSTQPVILTIAPCADATEQWSRPLSWRPGSSFAGQIMRIAAMAAGAVGGYFGARLAAAGRGRHLHRARRPSRSDPQERAEGRKHARQSASARGQGDARSGERRPGRYRAVRGQAVGHRERRRKRRGR